jgi:hypothetical protein
MLYCEGTTGEIQEKVREGSGMSELRVECSSERMMCRSLGEEYSEVVVRGPYILVESQMPSDLFQG